MTKVVQITTVHKRYDNRIFSKQCRSLAQNGYEVHLIVADGNGDEEKEGVFIHDIGIFHSRIERLIKSSHIALRKALSINGDIYHLHDPELISIALKLKQRGKVIFDSHEDIFSNVKDKFYIPKIVRPLISFIVNKRQTKVLKQIDAIISVTPHICEKLSKINNNVCMVTNYPIIRDDWQQNETKTNTIVFAGGITYQWLHSYVLDSLDKCPNVKYNLCGPAYKDVLVALKNHRNWNKVNYYGVISNQEVEKLLLQSKVGMALLEYSNNMGGKMGTLGNTKLFEYMEAGIPFICTDFTLWQQIVNKYDCGIFVDPHNVNDISNAINELIHNDTRALQMGQNGRKAVEIEFNWKSQEKVLLSLYDRLLI